MKVLPSRVIAKKFIDHMDSDDAADVIADLPDERREEVLSHIDDMEQAGDIVDLLKYDEDTASGLMAFFIPLIAAMGGNVGVPSIIVQALASHNTGLDSTFVRLLKELAVAMLNGIILSVLIFILSYVFYDNLALSLSVSFALILVIIFASIFGTFVLLALHRFKVDPALATGTFITTVNDITGLFIYLSISQVFFQIYKFR